MAGFDFAVHSLKDLETELPPGIVLACTLEREDARDALILAARRPGARPGRPVRLAAARRLRRHLLCPPPGADAALPPRSAYRA